MATTKNEYTGDGSTQLFPFTFPYIEESDVVVSVDGVVLTIITEYIFSNATTIGINTAPAMGAKVLIARSTSSDSLKATFFPGSAIRARDLNDNFTQNLYVTQEAAISSDDANEAARIATEAALKAQNDAAEAKEDAQAAAEDAQEAADAVAGAAEDAAEAQVAAAAAQEAATNAQTAADDAAENAQTAVDAVEEILDAVEEGAVVSVNGQGGVVALGVGDLTDVQTSGEGHVPSDGDALVWNDDHGHWMPGSSASKIIDQEDFAYAPASNTLVWPAGTWPTGIYGGGAWNLAYTAQGGIFDFRFNNTGPGGQLRFDELHKLRVGDQVIFNLKGVDTPFTCYQVARNIATNSWQILFQGTYVIADDYSEDELRITSPHFTNGEEPIHEGDTLRYDLDTATWRPAPGLDWSPSVAANTLTYAAGTWTSDLGGLTSIGQWSTNFAGVSNRINFIFFYGDNNSVELLSLKSGDSITFNIRGDDHIGTVYLEAAVYSGQYIYQMVVDCDLDPDLDYSTDELQIISPSIVVGLKPLVDGDILKYNSATQKWIASPSISISTLPTLP